MTGEPGGAVRFFIYLGNLYVYYKDVPTQSSKKTPTQQNITHALDLLWRRASGWRHVIKKVENKRRQSQKRMGPWTRRATSRNNLIVWLFWRQCQPTQRVIRNCLLNILRSEAIHHIGLFDAHETHQWLHFQPSSIIVYLKTVEVWWQPQFLERTPCFNFTLIVYIIFRLLHLMLVTSKTWPERAQLEGVFS